ncbi:MAG: hypothetical protein Q9200_007712 [Gallowayella weberi]
MAKSALKVSFLVSTAIGFYFLAAALWACYPAMAINPFAAGECGLTNPIDCSDCVMFKQSCFYGALVALVGDICLGYVLYSKYSQAKKLRYQDIELRTDSAVNASNSATSRANPRAPQQVDLPRTNAQHPN